MPDATQAYDFRGRAVLDSRSERTGGIVEIPKEQILQMLRDRGDHGQAEQAGQQLPDQVDPEPHSGANLLGQVGIDPGELLGGLGGKLGL